MTASRERNRRGEGSRLRADILDAATILLEESGSEQAVTLRAVARNVGISAPSIYAHFSDREAIVDAILDEAFSELNQAIADAVASETDALMRLRAGCSAYLRFAEQRPNRYRILFERRDLLDTTGDHVASVRTDGFDLLVGGVRDCVDAGISTSSDPLGDATAVWVALHGYATLHAGLPGFPWPPEHAMLDRIVHGLARVTDASSGEPRPRPKATQER